MSQEKTAQSGKSGRVVTELEIIVFGIIITLFCWWLFTGFGYWLLPGLVIVFIGLSELIYKLFVSKTSKASTSFRVGLLVFFIGLAGYLSFAMYVVFGIQQIFFVAVMVIGLIILLKEIIGGRKK